MAIASITIDLDAVKGDVLAVQAGIADADVDALAIGAARPQLVGRVGVAHGARGRDGRLDQIDRAGALRDAADMLLAESVDESRPLGEREVAREALMRLFSYCATAS